MKIDKQKIKKTKRINKISLLASPKLPTKYGNFQAYTYLDNKTKIEYLVITKGKVNQKQATNVRIHSECLTGDVFSSLRCDCGQQLNFALKYINKNNGILIYMKNQEGRGIGLINKMKAYELQEKGFDTVEANLELGLPADSRNYQVGAEILHSLKIKKINLLTNNPDKITGLEKYGLNIIKRIPIEIPPNKINNKYLKTKHDKMGHILKHF